MYDSAGESKPKENIKEKQSISVRFQRVVLGGLEQFFYKYGKFVARHPFPVIIFCLLFAGIATIPYLVDFKEEKEQLELWIPRHSEYYKNAKWLAENTEKSKNRFNVALLTTKDDTLLTREAMQKLLYIHDKVNNLSSSIGKGWNQICAQYPNIWTNSMQCAENSLLEIWGKNGSYEETNATIWAKSDDEILSDINAVKKSAIFNSPINLNRLLGSINKTDSTVLRARALQMTLLADLTRNGSGKEKAEEFEQEFIYFMGNYSEQNEEGSIEVSFFNLLSMRAAIGDTIKGDVSLLSAGFLIVFIYVMFMLGKMNSVEQRAYLSMLGVSAIGLGIATSYGVCQLIGVWYGPMNSILPFMLLGIGIDDMFVIVQGLNNVQKEPGYERMSIEERIGLTMKHSGVAILITSVTDLMAFGIGATSILPALGNFCAYAAFGIFGVFLQMASFFLAWLVIDQKRIDAKRDGCFCCMKKDDNWTPNECSQKSYMDVVFRAYSGILDEISFKITALVLTAALAAVSAYGVSQIETNFDFVDWFPSDTSVVKYLKATKEHFPAGGISGKVYIADLPKIEEKLKKIEKMLTNVGNVSDLRDNEIQSFLTPFLKYLEYKGVATNETMPEELFRFQLKGFLCFPGGFPYQGSITYVGGEKLDCKKDRTPPIRMMSFGYQHKSHSGNLLGEYNGYKDVQEAVKSVDLGGNESSRVFAHAEAYNNGVTLSVVVFELLRNMILALVSVFICVLFLMANFFATIIVCGTVSITLLDVAGFMQLWGITLDTSAAVLLSVALGLAVDYSAHIAHSFVSTAGKSKDERIKKTIIEMGPAVWNGGISTFLAFSILMFSKSFVFKVFFKIFFLVVFFGLFHGLVFLPVLLSFIGPEPSASAHAGSQIEPIELFQAKELEKTEEKNGGHFSSPVKNGTKKTKQNGA